MKKLYNSPQTEDLQLDPLMVTFADTIQVSVTGETASGSEFKVD